MFYAFLRLIRWPNLLIVIFTQCLVYFGLLLPAFTYYDLSPTLDPLHFLLFVLDTVMITAGGYVINDIIDFRVDLQNRPGQLVINRQILIQTAYWFYFVLNLLGFFLAFYLALYVGHIALANLFPLAVALLFFYSSHLQRWALLGNLLIALFCAGVAGIVWFAERRAFAGLQLLDPDRAGQIAGIIVWYMAFALLSTLYREIVKDLEDKQGDLGASYHTAPIRWGERTAKGLAAAFGLGLAVFISAMALSGSGWFSGRWLFYGTMVLLAPLLISLSWLFRARSQADYRRVSVLIKLVMAGGLLLLLLLIMQL